MMKLIIKLLLCSNSKHMALLLLVLALSIAKYSDALKLAKPGCQEKCGAVDIPYPFGIGPNCSFHEGFEVICGTHRGIRVPFHGNMEVISIMLTKAHTKVYNHASSQCFEISTGVITSFSNKTRPLNLKGTVYTLSKHHNKFVVFGCETLALNEMQDNRNNRYRVGCVSTSCHNQKRFHEKDHTCYGNGCCHTPIPYGIKNYNISFPFGFNSEFWNESHCNYAVVMETHNHAHAIDDSWSRKNAAVPVVLNWFIGNETCEVAQTKMSNYACVSTNSLCINAQNGLGYVCNCSHGYDGNPYLLDGCQDIDECKHHSICSGICFNKEGSYICISRAILVIVGVSTAILLLLSCLFCMQKAYGRRRIAQVRERYFQQNGGRLLLDEMKNNHGIAFTIFTEEELKEATNSFDKANMLGQGGNGTVFKGKLVRTNEEVAIKKCKTITERNKTEFGKEMLILSQINHKNIVRILGCCLELEIPILVYEFVPNGTLFHLLHSNATLHVPLKTRLRIAEEAGDALAYLHSWASPPIVHCDVKSANILLDENYAAKVSDFGASALAPSDDDQFITLVQGTRGYLDPQSIQTGQLTVKSDVYSFGVVLVELLTRRKAFFLEGNEERSLASAFLTNMKENRLEDLLDVQILEEGNMNLIEGVAELAQECLNMDGEMRPEMREVAEQLNKLRKAINQ